MEKFIPYEKLSKKEKRKLDQAKRQTWGNLNPVTRKPENSKAYNRNNARNWTRDCQRTSSGLLYYFAIRSSISWMVLGIAAERFSHPVSVTRQLSSRRKPMPHASW